MRYLLVVSVLFIGCGTSVSTEEYNDNSGVTLDPYADPPGYSGNPFAGFGQVSSVNFPAEEDPAVPVENQSSSGGLWSVQAAACSEMAAASNLRDVISAQTGQPVFIDQIGGYYKVRVGSFNSPEETEQLRNQLRAGGYPEAWSVERETTP